VRTLRVREDISALLQIYTRYTVPVRVSVVHLTSPKLYIQQVALQTQSHRRDRVDDAFATSTSRICLRLMRFKLDLAPRVATSLPCKLEGRSYAALGSLTRRLRRHTCARLRLRM
jgi:hypothetical protein